MSRRLRTTGIAAGVALLLGAGGEGTPFEVTLANAGFEELYLGSNLPAQYGGEVPTGSFPTGPPPAGWTAYYQNGSPFAGAFLGVLNPGTAADHAPNPACFPAGAPEGDNVVLLYMDGDAGGEEFGVEQGLGTTLQPFTSYTLTAEVGNIADCAGLVAPYQSFFVLDGFPGYRVQLLAGGQVLAEDPGRLTPPEGVFEPTSVRFTTGASHARLGQALGVRLVNRNLPDVPGVDGLEVDFDVVRLVAAPAALAAPLGTWSLPVAGLLLLLAATARIPPRRVR